MCTFLHYFLLTQEKGIQLATNTKISYYAVHALRNFPKKKKKLVNFNHKMF